MLRKLFLVVLVELQSGVDFLFVGKIVGEIACVGSLTSPKKGRISHQSEIALSVRKKFWNMGVGTELMKTLIDFAKQSGEIEIIYLGVRADNINAIRLYKKMGFEQIGLYKNYSKINGVYADDILMNLYL